MKFLVNECSHISVHIHFTTLCLSRCLYLNYASHLLNTWPWYLVTDFVLSPQEWRRASVVLFAISHAATLYLMTSHSLNYSSCATVNLQGIKTTNRLWPWFLGNKISLQEHFGWLSHLCFSKRFFLVPHYHTLFEVGGAPHGNFMASLRWTTFN